MQRIKCKFCPQDKKPSVQEYADGLYCFRCHRVTKTRLGNFYHKPKIIYEDELFSSRNIQYLSSISDHNIVSEMLIWLEERGISQNTASYYNVQFVKSVELYSHNKNDWYTLNNVIQFPIRNNLSQLVGYEYRILHGKVKTISDYISGAIYRPTIISHKTEFIVITEDIISSLNIDNSGYSALALMGTGLPNRISQKLLNILETSNKFILWLDGDKPGQTAAKKIQRTLQQFSPCANIITPKDPKYYSPLQITEIINNELSKQQWINKTITE